MIKMSKKQIMVNSKDYRVDTIWYSNAYSLKKHVLLGELWYVTDDLNADEGLIIRSISEGDLFVPQHGWQYILGTLTCSATLRLILTRTTWTIPKKI